MKIIKSGKIPSTEKKVTCANCGTIFAYDKEDVTSDQRDGNYVRCPLCKAYIDDSKGVLYEP